MKKIKNIAYIITFHGIIQSSLMCMEQQYAYPAWTKGEREVITAKLNVTMTTLNYSQDEAMLKEFIQISKLRDEDILKEKNKKKKASIAMNVKIARKAQLLQDFSAIFNERYYTDSIDEVVDELINLKDVMKKSLQEKIILPTELNNIILNSEALQHRPQDKNLLQSTIRDYFGLKKEDLS